MASYDSCCCGHEFGDLFAVASHSIAKFLIIFVEHGVLVPKIGLAKWLMMGLVGATVSGQ